MKSAALASLKGKMATAPHVLTQMMRLHQITCGHLRNDDGTITEIKNNRLKELINLLDEVEGKVIIWANYVYDIENLVKVISDEFGADSIVQYYGAIPAEQRQENIENFYKKRIQKYDLIISSGGSSFSSGDLISNFLKFIKTFITKFIIYKYSLSS